MGAFEYVALDPSGKQSKGLLEGDTPKHVRQMLRERQLLPVKVTEVETRRTRQKSSFMARRGMSATDLSLLTRQLATLTQSGLPLEEALLADAIAPLSGYSGLKREVKYGTGSRIDFLLTGDAKPDAYVEVKSVTLCRNAGLAEFPDSVTARGTKHLQELANMKAQGHRAVMFYLVQRTDCDTMTLARDIDPVYAAAFDQATAAGVQVLVQSCKINPKGVWLGDTMPYKV